IRRGTAKAALRPDARKQPVSGDIDPKQTTHDSPDRTSRLDCPKESKTSGDYVVPPNVSSGTRMKLARIPLAAFFAVLIATSVAAADYFPPRGSWDRKTPAELGIDAARLKEAIDYAAANENPSSKDVAEDLRNTFGKREPDFKILGPTQSRAALNGIVIHRGYVVTDWGDTQRADMAHRVTKSFLTTVVGLAWQRGLIRNLDDRASWYLPTAERAQLFGTEHNAPIT